MNYLGHAVLSFDDAELLTGNMIADHVKGKLALKNFPEGVQNGILLHRKIDQFTDEHPATARAKLLFRSDYGLYAGALMDSLYDHFLANDAKYFSSAKDLLDFTGNLYQQLNTQRRWFPPRFAALYEYMERDNWLYGYRNLAGVRQALTGLSRRAAYMPDPAKAFEIFIAHYYQLAQCYYEMMDDMARYVKVELRKE